MPAVNTLLGDVSDYAPVDTSDYGYADSILTPQRYYGVRDGTDVLVALIVLGAVLVLVGFQVGGFRSIITVGR